jgi:hypothetical protein
VKYVFIGKQKVVLYSKLKKNQRKVVASALNNRKDKFRTLSKVHAYIYFDESYIYIYIYIYIIIRFMVGRISTLNFFRVCNYKISILHFFESYIYSSS